MTQTTALTYKWSSPGEWLADLMEVRINARDFDGVVDIARTLLNATVIDSDTIQELFQSDMDADGYFKPIVSDALIQNCADHSRLVTISYKCRLLQMQYEATVAEGEEGIEDGKFTGARDTWGKWTFISEDGETTRYFFTDEIENIEAP